MKMHTNREGKYGSELIVSCSKNDGSRLVCAAMI